MTLKAVPLYAVQALGVWCISLPFDAAAQSISDCNDGLRYLQTVNDHSSNRQFQEDLKQYIANHDFQTSSRQFGGGATVPVDGVPVTFNLNQDKYQETQKSIVSSLSRRVSIQESEFLVQRWMSPAAIDAYKSCLAAVSNRPLVCQWIPGNDPNDRTKARLFVKNNVSGTVEVSRANIDNADGVKIDGTAAGLDLLASGQFPRSLTISSSGQSWIVERNPQALLRSLIANIEVRFQQAGNTITESCGSGFGVLPAIIPPQPECVFRVGASATNPAIWPARNERSFACSLPQTGHAFKAHFKGRVAIHGPNTKQDRFQVEYILGPKRVRDPVSDAFTGNEVFEFDSDSIPFNAADSKNISVGLGLPGCAGAGQDPNPVAPRLTCEISAVIRVTPN